VERFFGSLKRERTAHRQYATRHEAAVAVVDYIEIFYNSTRKHSFLGYVSPNEFEASAKAASLRVRFYLTTTDLHGWLYAVIFGPPPSKGHTLVYLRIFSADLSYISGFAVFGEMEEMGQCQTHSHRRLCPNRLGHPHFPRKYVERSSVGELTRFAWRLW
jgi:Integrase core domain